jgi:hypothetical protein
MNDRQRRRERFLGMPKRKRRSVMLRNASIALAGGTAIALSASLAAQGYGGGQQPTAAQPTTAQPNTQTQAATPPADAATTDDQSGQAADPKADMRAKPKAAATCGTVVRAGPNAGQVIDKCKSKTDTKDATEAEAPKSDPQ